MSVTEKPLKYVEYPDDLPNERFLVPQIDTAAGGMGTPGTVPESAATKAAFDALKEDLNAIGLSVVDGKLCVTYEEGA